MKERMKERMKGGRKENISNYQRLEEVADALPFAFVNRIQHLHHNRLHLSIVVTKIEAKHTLGGAKKIQGENGRCAVFKTN